MHPIQCDRNNESNERKENERKENERKENGRNIQLIGESENRE